MLGTDPDARGARDARLPDPASLFSSSHWQWRIAVRMTRWCHTADIARKHTGRSDGHGKIRDSARPAGDGKFWKRKPGDSAAVANKAGVSIPGLVTLRRQGNVCGTQTSRLPGPGRLPSIAIRAAMLALKRLRSGQIPAASDFREWLGDEDSNLG